VVTVRQSGVETLGVNVCFKSQKKLLACRAMRPGEVEGADYFFVTKQKFEQWLQQGDLLEHALVYGEYKGIPRPQVRK
jgi:guanylate kinase